MLRKIIAGSVLIILVAAGGLAAFQMTVGRVALPMTPGGETTASQDVAAWDQAPSGMSPAAGPSATGAAGAADQIRRSGAATLPAKDGPAMDSALAQLAQVTETQGADAAAGFANAHNIHFSDGRVQVVVESAAGEPTPAIAAVMDNGGAIEATYKNLVQASVPAAKLKAIAASAEVARVREPRRPVTSAVTSQGVADIGANTWQGAGYKGAGVKVAVIDPGFSGYTDRIASGDLPAGVITASFVAGGDITTGGVHGTACAEIVYDTAPKAQLYLINFDTDVELGKAVAYIQSQGIQVVSSSWSFPASSAGDGSGEVNDMVAGLNAAGVLWVNAAGNMAQEHWSGPFTDNNHDNWLEFSGSDNINNFFAYAGETISVYLDWNRWPVTNQDYDLLLYRAGELYPVAASIDPQTGSEPPVESFSYLVPTSGYYDVMVNNYNGEAAGDANMELFLFPEDLQYQVAAGSLAGQPTDSAAGLTAGAVQVGTTSLEPYSSQGPTTDGRIKPDLVGPDYVSTATYGPLNFGGTSAAAPHAVGAAALIRGAHPEYSPASTKNVLLGRATDLGAAGADNLYGSGKLNMGILPVADSLDYFFSWYDQASAGMQDWVVLANPSPSATATADVLVGSEVEGEYTVAPGQVKTPQYAGVLGGPARILSQGSKPLIVSQRSLLGSSFEEVLGVEREKLSDHYYWTWYDQSSPGYTNWVLVANPSDSEPVHAVISFINQADGQLVSAGNDIAPGKNWTPTFAGKMGGPVEVKACLAGGSWPADKRNIIASQRVLSNYGKAFNEVPGIPDTDLKTDYLWTWYDQQSAGATDWVLVANPNNGPVTYQIKINGITMSTSADNPGTIPAHGRVVPTFPGERNGPVEVISTGGNVIASQRVIWGPSFEEVPGMSAADLKPNYHWTWYDASMTGVSNWVLVANPSATEQIDYQILIGGTPQATSASNPGTIMAGERVTPEFPGQIGGPVEVRAWLHGSDWATVADRRNIMTSQRVLWKGYFNEVLGTVLQ